MKEQFHELYELTKLDRKKSAWSKRLTFEKRLEELKSEVEEALEAYRSRKTNDFKEELGDVYWDLTFLIAMAEEQGMFSGKDVMDTMIEKYKRRKPWVLEGRELNPEEEEKLWNEVKKKEKKGEFNE